MADVAEVRAKWERIAAEHPDAKVRERAKSVLARLPAAAQPTHQLPLTDAQKTKIERETAAGQTPAPNPSILDELGKSAGALGAGINENFAFGFPAHVMDALELSTPQERERLKAASPASALVGSMAGQGASALVGPEAGLGKAAQGLLGVIEQRVPAMATTAAGRVAGQAGAGALTGAAIGAGGTVSRGGDLNQAADAAKTGAAAGAALGGGVQAAGELGSAVSKGVRGISDWVKRYGEAADAGMYDAPEMSSLPRGPAGIQKAAETQLPRILGRDQELERDATSAYRGAVDPETGKPIDQAVLVDKLKQIQFKNLNQDTGLPQNKALDKALQEAIDEASPTLRQTDSGAFVGSRSPTVGGTLQNRRDLAKKASFGNPAPTPEQETARDTYQAYRQAVREASPTVRAADDAYSTHAGTAARRRDLLFGSENELPMAAGQERPAAGEPSDAVLSSEAPRPPKGKESRAVTMLKRVGDDNEPGLAAQRYIEELAAQDPEFAKAIEFIAAKKALEGTRLSLRGDALPTDIGGKTGLSGFMPLIKQNLRFLGGTADRAGTFARQMAPQGRLVLPGFIPEIEQAIEDGRAKQRSDR